MFVIFSIAIFIAWVINGDSYMLISSAIYAVAYAIEVFATKFRK